MCFLSSGVGFECLAFNLLWSLAFTVAKALKHHSHDPFQFRFLETNFRTSTVTQAPWTGGCLWCPWVRLLQCRSGLAATSITHQPWIWTDPHNGTKERHVNLEAREALEPRAPITVGCTPPCSVDIDPHNYYRNNQSEFRLDSVAKPLPPSHPEFGAVCARQWRSLQPSSLGLPCSTEICRA